MAGFVSKPLRITIGVNSHIGNDMLLRSPCAQINQLATLATKRPVLIISRPLHWTLAGGASHGSHRRSTFSSADSKQEGYILFGLSGTHGNAMPLHEANAAAMMTTTDFREEFTGGGQGDAQQLTMCIAIQV